MSIKKFAEKHPSNGSKISKISLLWLNQTKVDDFLGIPIFGSILVGDYLNGGVLIDTVPEDILTAMKELMPSKISSGFDARNYLMRILDP